VTSPSTTASERILLEGKTAANFSERNIQSNALKIAVKTTNFVPHGNFGPFLERFIASSMDHVPKMNRTKIASMNSLNNFHFSVENVFMIVSPSRKGKSPKVYTRSQVKGYDGVY
jgi:hypothetical protein